MKLFSLDKEDKRVYAFSLALIVLGVLVMFAGSTISAIASISFIIGFIMIVVGIILITFVLYGPWGFLP